MSDVIPVLEAIEQWQPSDDLCDDVDYIVGAVLERVHALTPDKLQECYEGIQDSAASTYQMFQAREAKRT